MYLLFSGLKTASVEMKKNRAFLKWAGGKYSLMDEIKRRLPKGDCLIEPFVGAGSVFLNTNYRYYILADINIDLINLYNTVKKHPHRFVEDCRQLFNTTYNHEVHYYQLREEFNRSTDPYQRSVLFLYLNRHCYNGLCRYNLRGEFNVPFGRYKRPYFPEKEIMFFAEKAKKATFICTSYEKVFDLAEQGHVIYCDPPYAPLSLTANFTAYHSHSFNLTDQQNLAKLASITSKDKQIPVLISNHNTESTRMWYSQAKLHIVNARRTISSNASSRRPVSEILALYT